MKAVVQRVASASVECGGEIVGAIGQGLLVLVGVTTDDGEKEAALMAQKIAHLRIFRDDNDKMNLSVLDIGGGVLSVSNFTLCADTSHGRRPSFIAAARPETAAPLYEFFLEKLREQGVSPVENGVFGGDMLVQLTNQGPVTVILDSDEWKK